MGFNTIKSLLQNVMGATGDHPMKGVGLDDLIQIFAPKIQHSGQKNNKLIFLLKNFQYFRMQDNNELLDFKNLMLFFLQHIKGEKEARR